MLGQQFVRQLIIVDLCGLWHRKSHFWIHFHKQFTPIHLVGSFDSSASFHCNEMSVYNRVKRETQINSNESISNWCMIAFSINYCDRMSWDDWMRRILAQHLHTYVIYEDVYFKRFNVWPNENKVYASHSFELSLGVSAMMWRWGWIFDSRSKHVFFLNDYDPLGDESLKVNLLHDDFEMNQIRSVLNLNVHWNRNKFTYMILIERYSVFWHQSVVFLTWSLRLSALHDLSCIFWTWPLKHM